MNKIIRNLLVVALFVGIFTLTGCTDEYEKPTLEITLENPLRTTIGIDFTIWDKDEMLIDLKVGLELIQEEDDEGYTDSKNITITGGLYEEEDEEGNEIEDGDFLGETESITFTGLTEHRSYNITFTGTYDDRTRTIHESITLTTSDEGSENNPWKITTYEDLNNVRNDVDGYFILENDITCVDADGKSQELNPLFSSSKKFVGDFDGNGKTISNFYQDSYDQDLGLFGNIGDDGLVYDLNVENVSINSLRYTALYAGGFVGRNTGTITNVHISNVEITTKGPDDGSQFVGGFVAQNSGVGNIENCSVTDVTLDLNVPGDGRIGGFAGTNESTTETSKIKNCHVYGDSLVDVQLPTAAPYTNEENVEIVLSIGGFIGDNRGLIEDSSTTANIVTYVDKTTLDKTTNPTDFTSSDVEESERHVAVKSMELNIAGFAGANFTGSIIDSTTSTSKIDFEVAFIDLLRVGGFVGYNDYTAYVGGCTFTSATYNLVVGKDTQLDNGLEATEEGFLSYLGEFVGLNNNKNEDGTANLDITTTGTITFTLKVRNVTSYEFTPEADDDNLDPEVETKYDYTFDLIYAVLNNILTND